MDEAPFAAAVAKHLGSDHSEMRVTDADALAVIPKLPSYTTSPLPIPHRSPPTWCVTPHAPT